jgi:hypothetical protein
LIYLVFYAAFLGGLNFAETRQIRLKYGKKHRYGAVAAPVRTSRWRFKPVCAF